MENCLKITSPILYSQPKYCIAYWAGGGEMEVKQIVFHHKTTVNTVALFYLQHRCLFNQFIGSNLEKIEPSWKNIPFHHRLEKRMCTDMLQFIDIYCTLRYIAYYRKENLSLYLILLSYVSNRILVCHISKKYKLVSGKQSSLYMYVCHIYFKVLTITSPWFFSER